MKTCAIVFLVIFLILVLILAGLAVYFFCFEKDLPQAAVNAIKDELKGLSDATVKISFDNINSMEGFECTRDIKLENAPASNCKREVKREGKDESFVMYYKEYEGEATTPTLDLKFYKENGKFMVTQNGTPTELDETEWKSYIVAYFVEATPFEEKENGEYGLFGAYYIEHNLSKIRQKGLDVKAYAYNNDDEYILAFNFMSLKLISYKITLKGTASGTVTIEYVSNLELGNYVNVS